MHTSYPELFHELSEPFGEKQIKTLTKGKTISYVTARTVMNRLDSVLGPENWWDDYTPQPTCVICKLTIMLPDGTTVTKVDAGGHAGMSDEGDDEKSGYSDAFKRAAVKFGVGRHLYGDGIPRFVREPAPTVSVIPADYDGPKTLKDFGNYLKTIDPDNTNGIRVDVLQWGLSQGFPDKTSKWSDAQARAAFMFIAAKLDAEVEV
jgi:hypothetical protein